MIGRAGRAVLAASRAGVLEMLKEPLPPGANADETMVRVDILRKRFPFLDLEKLDKLARRVREDDERRRDHSLLVRRRG